jgi:hypothetical protein
VVSQFQNLGNFIGDIRFTDVQKKVSALAKLLSRRTPEESSDLDGLNQYGFAVTSIEPNSDFGMKFDAVGGEVIVRTADGVAVSVLIGSLVENASAGDLNLNYNVMLYASVDESIFPVPEKQDTGEDEETEEKNEKAYLRAVEHRNAKIKSAVQRASDLNQSYADWYYVVPEPVIIGLRPDLTIDSTHTTNDANDIDKPTEGVTKAGAEPDEVPDN